MGWPAREDEPVWSGDNGAQPYLDDTEEVSGSLFDRLHRQVNDGLLPSFDLGAALGGYAKAMEQLAEQELI